MPLSGVWSCASAEGSLAAPSEEKGFGLSFLPEGPFPALGWGEGVCVCVLGGKGVNQAGSRCCI